MTPTLKPEKTVELAHPLRVALGQVIVDGDDVHAAPAERVEINRKRRDQRFAFAGFHFSNLALVQNHATDHLHIEMAHVEHAAASFAHHGKSFDQNLIQNFVDGLAGARLLSACGGRDRLRARPECG